MRDHSVVVTNTDVDRLSRLIRVLQHSLFQDQQQLGSLNQVLAAADVRPSSRIPKNIVRMNSGIHVRDLETRRIEAYLLAFPGEANIDKGYISVLAPVGLALLGRRKGEVIEVTVPSGIRRLKIEQVTHRADLFEMKLTSDRPAVKQVDSSEQIGTGLAA